MLLHQIWIFYIVICISSWLPSTNPSISLSSTSSNSFSKSPSDESSFYLPASSFIFSSSPTIYPINNDDDDPRSKQFIGESYRTRFTRSYRNFGLHRVDFNVPPNVVLGENTTAPESGPWSPWSEPSRCSRPCGGGVRSQKRFCTDIDVTGRSTCTGPDTRYYSCNIQPCTEPVDFRTQQCSMFNNQSIPLAIGKIDNIEWEPYTSRSTDRRPEEDLCALNCKPKNGTWYTRLMEQVIDGTKCLRETDWVSGICVAGNCLPVGCDGLLGSPAEEDKCRVCGGEGKECNTVRDIFAENLPAGYQDIVLIPRGATYIKIQELAPSRNFLAVRDSSGRYYLNGHWTFEMTLTDFEAGGTRFEYGKRPASSPTGAISESLYALGPLRSPLYIQMVYQDNTPGIEYEYSVPSNIPVPSIWAPADAYQYMLGSYGSCSRPCGKGIQVRPARCVRLKTGEFVPLEFCSKEIMPQLSRSCNEIDCPPAYHKSNWSSCICPGIKTRSVFCEEVRASGERLVLDDSKCGNEPKPNSISSCPPDDCYELNNLVGNQTETTEYKWNTTEWSKCSSRCGQGKRSREVTCVDLNGKRVHDSQCPANERPESEGVCASVPCEGGVDWVTSEWSNCSVPCGPIMSTRSVICAGTDGLIYDESVCGLERKPEETRNCTENPGCDYSWFTTDWSSCSASCGRGLQTRHVVCGLYDDDSIKVDETKCAGKSKPISVRTCRAPVECEATLYYGPWGPCQCGNEERNLLCLSTNTAGGKLPLEKCNVTTSEVADSGNNISSTGNETLTENENFNGNETSTGNEALSGNETLISNETSTNNEISPVSLTLILTNRTCEWDRPPKEEADVSDVAPEPSGNNSLPIDCCSSKYGCCPDKFTPRKQDFSNCFKEENLEVTTSVATTIVDQVTTVPTTNGSVDNVTSSLNNTESIRVEKVTPPACRTSTYGCCWDGIKPAFGPFKLGCIINCNNTLFGCCPDNKTSKTNETGLNCPPKCLSSPFGCCDDNITEAGVNRTNCPIIPIPGPGDTDENIEGSGANEICLEVEGSGDGDGDGNVTSSCSKPAKAKTTSSVTCSESVDGSNGTVCSLVSKEPTPPCNTTTFGCCPDGLTARKTDEDDCTCSGSEFGCCPDNKTLATGLNQEGCPCDTFPYKCCQDEYTRAAGPDYDGCICSRMLFGCCSDGITPARGPNQLGCGCKSTPYGCCPDNSTTAGGPNFSGCPCRTLPHGCCPDQKTPAKGPNSEGCPCESLTHGCCFDGVTPATGPNYAGCDCTKAPWHCCQDYTTVALGPNFEGCPGGPALEINRAPDACIIPRERGPCRNFTIKWYYDSVYGGCVRFWYGGCNGNGNRFQSEEECEKICINPDGYLRCNLSPVFGACGLNITKYYFNPTTRSCETFQYSGCLGNKNNFNTRTECEAFCLHPETLDRCDQPMDRGHCNRKQLRYHYDRSTDSCQPFDWGGCGGNQNNFNSVEDCQRRCSVVKKEMPETLCYLPRSEGKCLGRYPRWFFDGITQECREFIYTGCDGNHNRFVSKNDCEKMCNSTRRAVPRPVIPSPIPSVINPSIDICKLPVSTGSAECNERLVKWYYNDVYKECIPFDYRGCGGNGNRFNFKEDCEAMCSESSYFPQSALQAAPSTPRFMSPIGPPAPEPGVDQCTLTQSQGVSCLGRNRTVELRWSFDLESRSCKRFYYSGCGGTANNFRSENECISTCAHHTNYGAAVSSSPVSPPLVTPSSLPSPSPVWPETSIDRSTARPFSWPSPSSIAPSDNPEGHYQTETSGIFNIQSCILPKDPGTGQDSMSLWYYDPMDGVCKTFYYTGLGGNANRFGTRRECEIKCWSSQDTCRLPPVRGRCGGNYPVYYYDYSSRECVPFTYGGCGGNANRFDSLEECRMQCRN